MTENKIMDELDILIKLKNCYKELDSLGIVILDSNIGKAKAEITKKILQITENFDINELIKKSNKSQGI